MYTEEEAKKKWCPMVRIVGVDGKENGVVNRTSYNKCVHVGEREDFIPAGSECIASKCMMWEWEYEDTDPSTAGNGLIPRRYKKTEKGYCGRARILYGGRIS